MKKNIALLFLLFVFGFVLSNSVEAVPVCSFSSSVRGCSIYLSPVFNADVAFYQWSVMPGDGTTALGCTGWIPVSSLFTQLFSMDREGEYRVMLQARSSTGVVSEYSQVVRTMGSAVSAINAVQEPSPVNETFVSRFQSWFDSFPLLAQAGFIIIVIFLCIIGFDAVFHVSRGWRKKIFYRTEELKR